MKSKDDQRAYFYACPNCQSPVGEKCTQPTDTGRKPVSFIHSARLRLVEEADYFARENQRGERLDNRSKID